MSWRTAGAGFERRNRSAVAAETRTINGYSSGPERHLNLDSPAGVPTSADLQYRTHFGRGKPVLAREMADLVPASVLRRLRHAVTIRVALRGMPGVRHGRARSRPTGHSRRRPLHQTGHAAA